MLRLRHCFLAGAAAVAAIFDCMIVARVYAAFGPCNTTVMGGTSNTISCSKNVCIGTVVITVRQKTCANKNETACTQGTAPLTVTYKAQNCNGIPSGGSAPQVPPCACSQDLSTRTPAGKGTTC